MNIRGLFYGIATFLFFYFSTATALANEYYMPTAAHYDAIDQGKTCNIFRSVHAEAREKILTNKKLIKKHIFSLKQARDKLEACARERGVRVSQNGGNQEVLIAELCPSLYQAWIEPSYKVKMVAQDLQEAYQTSQITKTQIRLRCNALPKPVTTPEERSAALRKLKRFQKAKTVPVQSARGSIRTAEWRSVSGRFADIGTRPLGGF